VQGIIQSQDPKQSCPNPAHLTRHLLPFPLEKTMKMTAMAFYHLSKGTKKKCRQKMSKILSVQGSSTYKKVSRTFKRRHPLTKGVPHFYERHIILLYIRRLHSNWRGRTGYNHNKFLCKRIILFLCTHKLYHFIPCFVFKTCINSKSVTHISCKLSPVLYQYKFQGLFP